MALNTTYHLERVELISTERQRVEHQLAGLERRLMHHPDPSINVTLRSHGGQRQIQADVRLRLGPLGAHLVSHQTAETAGQAVRQAVEDIERQLERRLAQQRGEPSYGVPSRRLPKELRPGLRAAAREPVSERDAQE